MPKPPFGLTMSAKTGRVRSLAHAVSSLYSNFGIGSMSFLTGSSKSQASQATAVSGLQLQSSAYGKVVPIVYGTTRIAPNLIWFGDFIAIPQNSSGGGGGKGGVTGGGGGKSGGGSGSFN